MHIPITLALILGISIAAVVALSGGANDLMNNAMTVRSLEISNLSVNYFDSEDRLTMTVKNTGSTAIANVTAIVYAEGGITSNPVVHTNTIEKGDSQAVSQILTVLGTTNSMSVLTDKDISISINGTTYDGSVIELDPIKLKVK